MGCFRKQAIRHRSEVYLPRSWGYVFTEPISFMGLFSQTGVHPVKTTAIPWKPQWKPRVWQPFDLVTFRGNRTGNRQQGSHWRVRTRRANLECEPERDARQNAYLWCVLLACHMTQVRLGRDGLASQVQQNRYHRNSPDPHCKCGQGSRRSLDRPVRSEGPSKHES